MVKAQTVFLFLMSTTLLIESTYATISHPGYGQPEPQQLQKIPCQYDTQCHYNEHCGPYRTCECNAGYKVDPSNPSSCISAYSPSQLQPPQHYPTPPQQPYPAPAPPPATYAAPAPPPPPQTYAAPAAAPLPQQYPPPPPPPPPPAQYPPPPPPVQYPPAPTYPPAEPAVIYPPAQQLPGYQHELKATKFGPAQSHYPPPSGYHRKR